ncbi:MAG: hypothetical protein WBD07_17410 [Vicinamibacterales bacterium]
MKDLHAARLALLDVAYRLGLLQESAQAPLAERYTELMKGLQKLIAALWNEP